MNNNKVHVTLIASNKSGILSRIMLKGRKMGLMFQTNKTTKIDDDRSSFDVVFEGSLNCSDAAFIQEMEAHDQIYSVENIVHGNSNQAMADSLADVISTSNPGSTSVKKMNANDPISQKSLEVVEEKLTGLLGPVAPILIQSAITRTHNMGDLISLLAMELDGSEKNKILSLVDANTSSTANNIKIEAEPAAKSTAPKQVTPEPEAEEESTNSSKSLSAHDIINPYALQVAEEKLSVILGPVAPILVESAAEKTKHIGDLFFALSEELDGNERDEFLALVSDLDLQKL